GHFFDRLARLIGLDLFQKASGSDHGFCQRTKIIPKIGKNGKYYYFLGDPLFGGSENVRSEGWERLAPGFPYTT
ncbi:MAG: hypothetical protein NTV82_08790, partial [Candidatus Aminicenantes bacterium]|nr:hypothetical protein [Candidatus Aminicenantes bacterium]